MSLVQRSALETTRISRSGLLVLPSHFCGEPPLHGPVGTLVARVALDLALRFERIADHRKRVLWVVLLRELFCTLKDGDCARTATLIIDAASMRVLV